MRIGVDLDGVVYEFHRTVRYMLNHYREMDLPPADELFKEWWPREVSKEDWDWVFSEGIKLGLFRYGHMTRGARVGLQALHDAGHDLLIITHRPETAVNDTIDWASLYFRDIPLAGINILSHGEPKYGVKADLLIDDKWENVRDWMEQTSITEARRAILFDAPWNNSVPHKDLSRLDITRAIGWSGVVSCLTS